MSTSTSHGGAEPAAAIRVHRLEKLYRRTSAGHKLRTLKSALLERSLIRGLRPEESIAALRGMSFEIPVGQAVGIIGANGSGKSTLLKILAGILRPTRGTVEIDGRVAALIELGAGFHPEISGRENVFINGAVLGLTRRQVAARFDDIIAFSGLADFIEEPVKNYSSGMYVRLGFAVAIHTDPDVLLVDEVLSVGDEAFAHKCLRRIEEFLARGKTLVLVSHALSLIEGVCDRALWLEHGELRLDGHPRRVVDGYRQAVAESEGRAHRRAKEQREDHDDEAGDEAGDEAAGGDDAGDDPAGDDDPDVTGDGGGDEAIETGGDADATGVAKETEEVLRWGSGEARIERLRVLAGDEERYHVESGEAVTFELEVTARRDFRDFVFGIALTTPRGVECWGTNTDLEGFVPECLPTGRWRIAIVCPNLRLAPGEYRIDVAVHARDGTPYDYRRRLVGFTVTADTGGVGVYFPEHTWSFPSGVVWSRRGDEG